MKSIASLAHVNRHAGLVALREQQSALYDAIAELEQAAERIEQVIHDREQARDYAHAAAFEGRDYVAPARYADIRGL
ncbi:MAG: hypothetical protein MUE39_09355 [Gammaproteobacteria bacterium]|jgi:hypothetical protein|nr:hypothetical protein [Gammaproteobacteria bacterium]